ncbi:MAG: hypothetical protein GX112_08745, partial [Clostridiaceae bacterium]|nr:hypothetical protein [Clostridiaceae bacterium]
MLQPILLTVKDSYQAWWDGTNTDAVIWCRYNTGTASGKTGNAFRKDWMTESPGWTLAQAVERVFQGGDFAAVDEALDYVEAAHADTGYAGDGFPSYFFNLGAGCAAAMISQFFQYYNNTVWFERDEPLDWNQILSFDPASPNPYWELVVKTAQRVAARFQGRFVVSNLDLGGNLDILASLRRSGQLLYDVMDEPEKVKLACERIWQVWQEMHAAIDRIVLPANGGFSTSWMSILSPDTYYPSHCVISAMLSPGMFDAFVVPYVSRDMALFRKGLYHLDGPGELVHLDLLCTIPNLHAIQWVPGPAIGFLDDVSFALYRRIIEKGKK